MSGTNKRSVPEVGLVGVSGYGSIHLKLLQRAQEAWLARLAAAVVINPDEESHTVKMLRDQGARIYTSFEEFIDAESGRLDLCCVPTGIQWHAPMSVAALEAGMNVLVEKPLAGCLADADRIVEAERRSGRFVALGFQDMYAAATLRLKKRLVEGAIGDVRTVRFVGMWPRSNRYYWRNSWAGRLKCDGIPVHDSPFNNALAHFVYLAQYLAGRTLEETARVEITDAQLFRAHDIESFDTGVVRGRTAGGVQLWLGASHACRETRPPEIRVQGSRGTACWLYDYECVVAGQDGPAEVWAVPTAHAARWDMIQAVLARVKDENVSVSSASAAREHTALIEAIHAAAPIVTVDDSVVDRLTPEGVESEEYIPAIRGLYHALDSACNRGAALSLAAEPINQHSMP